MTLAGTAELVEAAVERGSAVGAFNVITLEHAEAIAAGAERAGTDAILQVSENAVRFHGGAFRPLVAACREMALASMTRLALHFDHVEDRALVDAVFDAGDLGVGSIMIDASRLPYDANVAATRAVAERGATRSMWIEAELGEIGGKDGAHAPGVRTDPAEARAFVEATGVNGLAVAVGSSHAMRDRSAAIDLALVERIAATVPVPLVLHGSSGVPDDVIRAAVAAGIRKVNVGTALNVAGMGALKVAIAGDPAAVDPRPSTRAARLAMTETVEAFCRLLT